MFQEDTGVSRFVGWLEAEYQDREIRRALPGAVEELDRRTAIATSFLYQVAKARTASHPLVLSILNWVNEVFALNGLEGAEAAELTASASAIFTAMRDALDDEDLGSIDDEFGDCFGLVVNRIRARCGE